MKRGQLVGLALALWAALISDAAIAPEAHAAPTTATAQASAAAPATTVAKTTAAGPAATAAQEVVEPSSGAPRGPSPHGVSPHGALGSNPHGEGLVTGGPFDSPRHSMQAAFVRQGRSTHLQSGFQSHADVPTGTIAILVQDGNQQPLSGVKVKLLGVRHSIEGGDKTFEAETITDAEGRAAFSNQETDSNYSYDVVVERDGAEYASGKFHFSHGQGVIVSLYVFPVTTQLKDVFVFSRALYAIEPRADVFQVQALYRFHNASNATWKANAFPIRLPEGAKAFQPGNAVGVKLREEGGSVLVDAAFTPGQQEFTYSFQLPNERTESVTLALPTPPNMVDVKVILESSTKMSLRIDGFDPAITTKSPDGQLALLAQKDFLNNLAPPPSIIRPRITGLPPKSRGPLYASLIAGVIALFGFYAAFSRGGKMRHSSVAANDLENAKQLILDELVALEAARKGERIGPKTYEQTKRSLLDALARLEIPEKKSSDPAEQSAPNPDLGEASANRAARS